MGCLLSKKPAPLVDAEIDDNVILCCDDVFSSCCYIVVVKRKSTADLKRTKSESKII